MTNQYDKNKGCAKSKDSLLIERILLLRYGRDDGYHYLMDNDYYNHLYNTTGSLPKEDINKANDWVMVAPKDSGWTKYGRLMYSPSLNRLRSQTFSEFYDGGIVD